MADVRVLEQGVDAEAALPGPPKHAPSRRHAVGVLRQRRAVERVPVQGPGARQEDRRRVRHDRRRPAGVPDPGRVHVRLGPHAVRVPHPGVAGLRPEEERPGPHAQLHRLHLAHQGLQGVTEQQMSNGRHPRLRPPVAWCWPAC